MPTRQPFHHRGFTLDIRRAPGGVGFAFAITHDGLLLHTSRPDFGTAVSADRAARCFVDDALGAFDVATQALAA